VPGCDTTFADPSYQACLDKLACCERWDDASEACEAVSDEGTCVAQPSEVCDALGLSGAECTNAAPCAWDDSIGCHFAYPTCCGANEAPRCSRDLETGNGSLFCFTECICDPPCGPLEVCEQVVGTGACGCFTVPM